MKKVTKRRLSVFAFYFFVFVSLVQGVYPYSIPPAILEETKDHTPHPKVVKRK
ncbi:hypothetical protein [Paenibacillus sp. Mc5Re-14]|uniref:hypothetical protein n=1 Tax=Paenibacillus sp. Mc5Re-14 TaxID=1030529 RepID=UPI000A5FC6CF|nr:hypothetical protein [Paenibacillus sp. Mc5Re-14]